ncbi:MAG: ATP-binding cassette domain-containing protein [Methylibium sp.]|nr:ATP-binding cassette domain-containing protein [Methylibium sp.]
MSFALESVGLVHPNGQRALRDVSLSAAPGERLAIIGPSGAGKTTLLRVLATALRPGEGRALSLSANAWQLSAAALRKLRARIGVVHQAPPIPPRLRVVTAVLAGRLGRWGTGRALASLLYPGDIAGAREALARLDMADRLFDRCDRLSGGQLQRVGIARVLYQAPELLLADEPVSALDPALADAAVGQLIAHSETQGATLVASLHAVDLALKWFPRIVGMRAGELAFDLPAGRVTRAMLQELYATEGTVLPTQCNDPAEITPFDPGGPAHRGSAVAALPREGGESDASPTSGARVLPLTRPGCR